ncbi:SDR family oxidoreductase [Phytohabitans sp. ZYX-F-186]|uniref:SDR family oxidoreductase n=1 Tax=Phytohabitans maris TaxID=3071409 RepID=A0ABU0Z9U1_9ACTN|nr:SDR family oxidoreductase [Phytohabitans sp. ZYX-F-186]MDQ7903805.1 SDR family oxidoreductase [Phytohabitans sp. ZYX-F-186]
MTAPYAGTPFDLTGKVALVTGGSRGLGARIGLGLARAGADIVVASRDLDSCRHQAERITAETGRAALPYGVHVGHWAELPGLVDAAYERFGRIDVLVNNAGMSPVYDTLESVSEELFDKVIGVNLKGPFRLSALVGARMAAGAGGSIVNVSSGVGVRPRAGVLPYAAAKAGLNNLTVGLAHTYGPSVRCNAVVCGTFLTDVSRHWDPEAFAARAATFALRRGGQPEEIVGTVLYLASAASSFTTGALITVDGGQP